MKHSDLLKFNSCSIVSEFKRNVSSQSLFEIVGIERNEIRHSRFIQWLLSDQELNVDNADSPLFHLFDAIVKRASEQGKVIKEDLLDMICSRSCSIRNVSVEVEHETKGVKVNDHTGKIDIFIRGELVIHNVPSPKSMPFAIAIENKVDSSEHSSQTLKYEAYLKGRRSNIPSNSTSEVGDVKIVFSKDYKSPLAQDGVPLFVYLTPSTECEMNNTLTLSSSNYIHINYQDLVDHILDPINEDFSVSSDKKYKIKQYLITLSIPSVSKSSKNKIDTIATAMAVSKDLKTLSCELWNKHHALIKEAITNGRNSTDLAKLFYETNKTLISAVLNAILVFSDRSTCSDYNEIMSLVCKINKKYYVCINGEYNIVNQTNLAVEYAKFYQECHAGYTVAQLNSDFKQVKSSLWENKSNTNKVGTCLNTEINKGLFFANNCWGSTGNSNYLFKLIEFIKNKNLSDFTIID